MNYEMTEVDLKVLQEASKPTTYMVIGGVIPDTPQQNANRAWEELGRKMGFDHMTAQPSSKGNRFFTATPIN